LCNKLRRGLYHVKTAPRAVTTVLPKLINKIGFKKKNLINFSEILIFQKILSRAVCSFHFIYSFLQLSRLPFRAWWSG
jgi:hypothetical protein